MVNLLKSVYDFLLNTPDTFDTKINKVKKVAAPLVRNRSRSWAYIHKEWKDKEILNPSK